LVSQDTNALLLSSRGPGKSLVMNSLRPFRAPEKAGLAPSLGHLEVLRDGDIQASRPAEGRLGVESFWPQWNF